MAEHNNLGALGETIARQYQEKNGYLILETNWRVGKLEADIIAYKDNLIVFIEVKTRTTDYYGDPEDFVDRKKQKAYIRLANSYILLNNRTEEARFDIISIIIGSPESEPQVKHIVNAFTTIG